MFHQQLRYVHLVFKKTKKTTTGPISGYSEKGNISLKHVLIINIY